MDIKKIFDALQEAFLATGIDYYLIGAQARNIWYEKARQQRRHTQDVDFVVMVPGGERYERLRNYLSENSRFRPTTNNDFVMLTPEGEEVDIMPFDAMDAHGNTQALLNGLTEVYHTGTVTVAITTGHRFKIATLPAIVALKLVAFDDRPEFRDKDPGDIAGILRVYFEIEHDKIYEEHSDLFTRNYLELEDVSAIVIGREIKKMGETNPAWLSRLSSILSGHIAAGANSLFIRMMIGSGNETAVQQVKRLQRILEGINDSFSSHASPVSFLLALKGAGNTGKTTTIRKLYKLLIKKGFETIQVLHGDPGDTMVKGDFSAVLGKGKIRIGITSVGDTFDLLVDRLNALHDRNCPIYICACRSFDRGRGTNTAIAEFSERYNCEVVTTHKQRIADETAWQNSNETDAEKMLEIIQGQINIRDSHDISASN